MRGRQQHRVRNGDRGIESDDTRALRAFFTTCGAHVKLAAGAADLGPNGQTTGSFIVRYNSDGSLDRSFGRRGEVTTVFDAAACPMRSFVSGMGSLSPPA